ncbi:MAG: cobyrinate a,c-diamide synthase [Candidatus Rokuibacteriota bacterium]|nr:MAG: cobyrinate a,c-diamide synthase [Candidatus Rokubacteria bacterium]
MARALVIAGTSSGVGKTTVTLGLLEAYRRRGLRVQAFKVGPDFIDPGLYELVTGRASYNLDGWMCGRDHVRAIVARHAAEADVVIVEGVMGCFDGAEATSNDGSTAQIAKWLDAPVVLVIDASAQARSAAAVVRGFEAFDPQLRVAAVIANRLGSEGHARLIRDAVGATCQAEFVGGIRRDPALELPERHLGLVTAVEGVLTAELRECLATTIERSVDLDHLLAVAAPPSSGGLVAAIEGERYRKGGEAPLRVRIGVAHDVAFQFYYRENLERLREAGAELVFWSPLTDADAPDVDGFYFGGGYPELHARALADNAGVVKTIGERAEAGAPIYAECGGLMYLAARLEGTDGEPHAMVGVLPAVVSMSPRHLTLGYSEVRFVDDTPLGPAGTVARGHEFHCSTLGAVPPDVPRAYRVLRGEREYAEGFLIGNTLLSYVHLHFGSNPKLAPNFAAACAKARRRSC